MAWLNVSAAPSGQSSGVPSMDVSGSTCHRTWSGILRCTIRMKTLASGRIAQEVQQHLRQVAPGSTRARPSRAVRRYRLTPLKAGAMEAASAASVGRRRCRPVKHAITGDRAGAVCAGMARGADLVTELVLNHQLLELALEKASSLDLRFGRDAVGVRLWCTREGGPRQPPPRQRSRRGVSRPRRTGRLCRPRAWGRAGAAA